MPVQTQHRFSVKDYHRMAETGLLSPEARVELFDGQIIDMSPIGPFHAGVVKYLARFFNQNSNRRWTVSTQDPLHLDEFSEPEPDLMLLKPVANDYKSEHPEPDDVFLLIEVADASLNYDRTEKLSAYGRAGIPEVWIVNLIQLTIEVYREPHFTGYGKKNVLRSGDKVVPAAFPDAMLDISELLKR